jgi:hypothetical protein
MVAQMGVRMSDDLLASLAEENRQLRWFLNNRDKFPGLTFKEAIAAEERRQESHTLKTRYELALYWVNNSELKPPRKNKAKPMPLPKRRGRKRTHCFDQNFIDVLPGRVQFIKDFYKAERGIKISDREAIRHILANEKVPPDYKKVLPNYTAEKNVALLAVVLSKQRKNYK